MAAKISRVPTLSTALAEGAGGSPYLAFLHPGQVIPLTGVSTSLLCKAGSEGLGAAGGLERLEPDRLSRVSPEGVQRTGALAGALNEPFRRRETRNTQASI